MNTDEESEDIVQRILTGELDPTDPSVAARLRREPELQQRLEAMLAVQRDVEASAQLERAVLREAGVGPAPANVRRRLAPVRVRPWWAAAAAAGLLLLGFAAREMFLSSGDVTLDAGDAPQISSVTRGSDSVLVRWAGAIEPEHYYRVLLRDPDSGVELARSLEPLRETQWLIRPVPDNLGAAVEVVVEVRSPTDRVRAARATVPVGSESR